MDLACVAETSRETTGDTVIFTAPANRSSLDLSTEALANLIRRRTPSLNPAAADDESRNIHIVFDQTPRARAQSRPALPQTQPLGPVHFGDDLTLHVSTGPVVIERALTAMQDNEDGENIFVRTEDGQVLSLPVARLRRAEAGQ